MRENAPERGRLLNTLRLAFLITAVAFGWWGLNGRWDEIGAAITSTSIWKVGVSGILIVVGIGVTSSVWMAVLKAYGRTLPPTEGRRIFFVGQLGKYIPGSVWSVGAQVDLARDYQIPVRTTVMTSLVFLGFHVATGAIVAAVAGLIGWVPIDLPQWLLVVVLVGSTLGMNPRLLNLGGTWLAGSDHISLSVIDVLRILALQLVTWVCYGGGIAVLAPSPSMSLLAVAIGAFAASYAIGVLFVIAPAGLGAREVVLVALLTPELGLANSTGVALLTRVLHTVGDLLLAGVSWEWARRRHRTTVGGTSSPTSCGSPVD